MKVNRDKTEHARIYLAPKGSPGHGNEAWRQMKTLGSRLDSAVEEQARINLAQLSMRKLHGMWGASKVNLVVQQWHLGTDQVLDRQTGCNSP